MMLMPRKNKNVFMDVPINELKLDKDIQLRSTLNRIAIADYADEDASGTKFPPVDIFWIPGSPKYVADGFHRVLAFKKNKRKTVRCKVHTGTKRDAILFAAGANRSHGVRRTSEDKRKTVLMFLNDSKWKVWADKEIARHAGVAASMVSKYRKWMHAEAPKDANGHEIRTYTDRSGATRTISVSGAPRNGHEALERTLKGELCPYCKQRMPGNQHKIRS